MRVVSFSLWGELPKYNAGAVRNAALCREMYTGWTARFYVGTSVPAETLRALRALDAQVIEMDEPGDWRGMFWRFEAASDPAVEAMISRDCDSRLNRREAAAVAEWMASDAAFHIMRDHPAHCTPILGGMWGVKAPLLRDCAALIRPFAPGDFWQADQDFLRAIVFPRVKRVALVHDEWFDGRPFPTPRRGLEFVGQVFDEHEQTPAADEAALQRAMEAGIMSAAIRRLRLHWCARSRRTRK
jgi:protein O-GlcNAc transferase